MVCRFFTMDSNKKKWKSCLACVHHTEVESYPKILGGCDKDGKTKLELRKDADKIFKIWEEWNKWM